MSSVDQKENLLLSEEVIKVSYEKYSAVSVQGNTHRFPRPWSSTT